jgi:hypothetical protein
MELDIIDVESLYKALDGPVRAADELEGVGLLAKEQLGLCILSGTTRAAELRRLKRAEQRRKGLRERKPYTRRAGTVHPKKKKATQTRKRAKLWAERPFSCYIAGYGCYNVDREQFEQYIMPLWNLYSPKDMTLKRRRATPEGKPYGTRSNPYDIYSFDIVHKKEGVVYAGQDRLLYDLSDPDRKLV